MTESEREEFRAYVAARGAALLRTAVLITGDRGLAEDLVQTALVRTYGSWGRIQRREAVDAYVRRVMVNTYVNWWRRRWRGELPTESLPERPAPDALSRVDDGLSLHDALARLPRRMRAVVVLRYYDDLPDREIAAILGCSTGTVRSQASRALDKLRSDGALALDFERGGR
ncbi:MAG TPA: SigE family RNA polymerase sigma factor [Mycobacteriales bacterium]|nr:SigE family RNA polymerase sigma factor [Mycobacteriales bacterium]